MGDGMTVRNATGADAEGMLGLWRSFWKPQPYEANLPRKIETEPDLVLVAEADGRIVGTTIGGFDGWWAWIYRVAVAPEYQRRGIATRLVREMHRRLQARGADSAAMVVSPTNEKMAGMLGKLGYHASTGQVNYGIRFEKRQP